MDTGWYDLTLTNLKQMGGFSKVSSDTGRRMVVVKGGGDLEQKLQDANSWLEVSVRVSPWRLSPTSPLSRRVQKRDVYIHTGSHFKWHLCQSWTNTPQDSCVVKKKKNSQTVHAQGSKYDFSTLFSEARALEES